MMMPDQHDQHHKLAELLGSSRKILVFTGAGISTGSGIPDFRGPRGIWKTKQPVFFDEFLASEDKRIEYWDFKVDGYDDYKHAQPNAAHRAIAKLESLGRLQAVVTQNIDGLHQDGGLADARVIEVHGTNRWIECLDCGQRTEPEPAVAFFTQHRKPPKCACGGWLKPATISFGQALNPEVLERAAGVASEADLALSLGSTLAVNPAATIPLLAVRNGAPYVIINRGQTEHDSLATLKIDEDVVEVLPPAVETLAPAN